MYVRAVLLCVRCKGILAEYIFSELKHVFVSKKQLLLKKIMMIIQFC